MGVFSHVFSFSFFLSLGFETNVKLDNVDAFSKVRHTSTGFPKRCGRILISNKDMLKTQIREVYIMMILCDTKLRTSVLLKKGQTAIAGKKVGPPRFSCGISKFEG